MLKYNYEYFVYTINRYYMINPQIQILIHFYIILDILCILSHCFHFGVRNWLCLGLFSENNIYRHFYISTGDSSDSPFPSRVSIGRDSAFISSVWRRCVFWLAYAPAPCFADPVWMDLDIVFPVLEGPYSSYCFKIHLVCF